MTDKVDTTNNEANANFSGMPSLETLWQVQQNEGSDGFYRTYIEAAKTAQTIIHNNLALLQQQAAVLAEAVAALDMQVAVAAELKERNDFAKTLEEVANTTRIVNSTLGPTLMRLCPFKSWKKAILHRNTLCIAKKSWACKAAI